MAYKSWLVACMNHGLTHTNPGQLCTFPAAIMIDTLEIGHILLMFLYLYLYLSTLFFCISTQYSLQYMPTLEPGQFFHYDLAV